MRAPLARLVSTVILIGACGLAGPVLAGSPPIDPELRALLKKAAAESDSFGDRFDAEVWLADMSQRLAKKLPYPELRVEQLKTVHYEAKRARLQPELVLALIEVESNFNPYAISGAGARGLMQVMPFWLKEIGKPGDSLFRVRTNLRYGCTILKYYLDKEHGDLQRALARYNGSLGQRTYPARVYHAYYARWYPQ
jgi:soluble lytic murein transglycosylase-like protein